MAEVTYYVALADIAADDGIAAGEPTECFSPVAVVMRAEALSRKEGHVGAIAFSRAGNPAIGDFSDAKVIRKFGDMPNDLSAHDPSIHLRCDRKAAPANSGATERDFNASKFRH
jgi:hypothetical protein